MKQWLRRTVGLLLAVQLFGAAAGARAAGASTSQPTAQRHAVGFAVFRWTYRGADGATIPLTTGVWYPAVAAPEKARHAYSPGFAGSAVADAAPNRVAGPFPLIVFSHGYGGGAIASVFLMEHLASRGYVVAAPDHNDPVPMLRIGGPTGATVAAFMKSLGELLGTPRSANRRKHAYRPRELKAVLEKVLEAGSGGGATLSGLIDPERIGCGGHSMGGYAALGLVGCEPRFTDARIKAAVLLSPAVFMCGNADYARVRVPAMYMYGQFERRNRLAKRMDARRAYTHSAGAKWLIGIRRGIHMTFNDGVILRRFGQARDPQAVRGQHEAICRYTTAMFDRYLRASKAAEAALAATGPWVSEFRSAPGHSKDTGGAAAGRPAARKVNVTMEKPMSQAKSAYETKVLMIGSRRLMYADEGRGPAVLILHGARSFPGQWDWQMQRLIQAGYRAIYPHRAGRLDSDPHEGPLSLAKDARDVFALLDHLGVKKFVVMGHSQGAFVARQVLLSQPDRVRGVVSVDSGAFGKLSEVRRMGPERFDAKTLALFEKHKATLAECDRLWEYPSDYNVARVVRSVKVIREQPDLYERTTQKPDPDDITPRGRYCKAPLLAFAAGRGRIRQGDPEAAALQKRLSANDARLVVVTESGHGIHEEQPELFSRELLQFLKKLDCPN